MKKTLSVRLFPELSPVLFPALWLGFLLLWVAFPVTVRAEAAQLWVENRADTETSLSCDVKLSPVTGTLYAAVYAEAGQFRRVSAYPAADTVQLTLGELDNTDLIKLIWTDDSQKLLAAPVVCRMSGNQRAANEDFTDALKSLRFFTGADGASDEANPYALCRLLVSCETLPDLRAYQVEVISGPNNLHVLQFTDTGAARSCEQYLSGCPSVRYVEPDIVMGPGGGETATLLDSSPYHSWGTARTGLDAYAEDLRQRDRQHAVVVAVVDSGVDGAHPFLRDWLLPGYDFVEYDDLPQDENGHGTHVAGTVVDGLSGLDVKLLPVRVLNAYASGSFLSIANGIRYAADHGANIINLSLGSARHSQTLEDAINDALSKNVTVVVAAGNGNGNAAYFCPAHMENCITVAAVDSSLKRYGLSNYGETVDLAAPGVGIESSIADGSYGELDGTSMAAPHVSAAAALVLCDRGTGLTPTQLSGLLKGAAEDLGETEVPLGAGFLNLRPFVRPGLYAILYADGELVFQGSSRTEPDREAVQVYLVTPAGDAAGQYAGWYSRRRDITKVTFAEVVRPVSTALWFYGCENLAEVSGMENLDTSAVTDMTQMFARCTALETLDLSGMDTGSVTRLGQMFFQCSALKTIYASDTFRVGGVTEDRELFTGCTALVGGSGTRYDSARTGKEYARIDGGADRPGYFTDKNAPPPEPAPSTEFYAVLYRDGELVFQSSDRTEAGRSVYRTYKVSRRSSQEASAPWAGVCWDILTVTFADRVQPASTAAWFDACFNLTEINGLDKLDTSKVTDMSGMFSNCEALTELDLSGFDTSHVTTMNSMFYNCPSLRSLDLSGFDTSKVTDMWGMFWDCGALEELNLSGFDTSRVTDMGFLFCNCASLRSLDLSSFHTGNVYSLYELFSGCSALKTIYAGDGFVTDDVMLTDEMFEDCVSLTGGAGTRYSGRFTDGRRARIDGGVSSPGYFTRRDET